MTEEEMQVALELALKRERAAMDRIIMRDRVNWLLASRLAPGHEREYLADAMKQCKDGYKSDL